MLKLHNFNLILVPLVIGALSSQISLNAEEPIEDTMVVESNDTTNVMDSTDTNYPEKRRARKPWEYIVSAPLWIATSPLYLLYKGTVSWYIPAAYIGSAFFLSLLLDHNPFFHLFAGSLLFGAFFYATDVVTSPVTRLGRILYGAGAGVLTIVIRVFGGFPEGVCYSILLMNAVTPLVDRYTVSGHHPAVDGGTAQKEGGTADL